MGLRSLLNSKCNDAMLVSGASWIPGLPTTSESADDSVTSTTMPSSGHPESKHITDFADDTGSHSTHPHFEFYPNVFSKSPENNLASDQVHVVRVNISAMSAGLLMAVL